MRASGFAALPALLALTGCGGGDAEDFTVEVKRPLATVYAPLSSIDLAEARRVFPGIAVDRSRPSDAGILYTILGSGDRPTTIRFQLEPRDGGSATAVHAFVSVPAIRATIDGVPKEVSERKVELALQSIVKSTARSLEMGSSAKAESAKLSIFMAGIAVATNKDQLARALELKNDPEKLMSVLLAFGAPNEQPEPSVEGREIRTADPEAGEREREVAEIRTEWKQEERLERAAAPTSNLDRYDN